MAKKNDNKQSKSFDLILKIGYLLVVLLIFSPLTFLIANTFTEEERYDCYGKVDDTECFSQQEAVRDRNDDVRFYIVSVISIIVVLLLLFLPAIHHLIGYGLFFGSALNTIIVISSRDRGDVVGTIVGVVLFVLVLVFINRQLKK